MNDTVGDLSWGKVSIKPGCSDIAECPVHTDISVGFGYTKPVPKSRSKVCLVRNWPTWILIHKARHGPRPSLSIFPVDLDSILSINREATCVQTSLPLTRQLRLVLCVSVSSFRLYASPFEGEQTIPG